MAHLPKMFLSTQIVAIMHHKQERKALFHRKFLSSFLLILTQI